MTSLSISGIAYCKVDWKQQCLGLQYEMVANEEECKLASEFFGVTFGGNETHGDNRKGCYMYSRSGTLFWNMHAHGNDDDDVNRPICKNCKGNIDKNQGY